MPTHTARAQSSPTTSAVAPSPAPTLGALYTRRQRFGVAFVSAVSDGQKLWPQSLADYAVAQLGVGWFLDWRFQVKPPQPADVMLEYVQLLGVRAGAWPPDWTIVQQALDANPGSTWIIGNEPEGPHNQGNLTPGEYARIYHEAYTEIKNRDPKAQIAIGGVIQPTPLRLRWLDEVMVAYQLAYGEPIAVDIWNIHVQILQEKSDSWGAGIPVGLTPRPGEAREYTMQDCVTPQVFEDLVSEFRLWMKRNGQQNKPLIISEMGVLLPSDYLTDQGKEQGDRLIEQFMVEVFDWLLQAKNAAIGCPHDEGRLVQRWLWFSLNDSFYDDTTSGFNGSLFDYRTKTLTRFGSRFATYQR